MTVKCCHCYGQVASSACVHFSIFKNFGELFKQNMRYLMVSKKKNGNEDGILKSVPCDQRLSSLGKPPDAYLGSCG